MIVDMILKEHSSLGTSERSTQGKQRRKKKFKEDLSSSYERR